MTQNIIYTPSNIFADANLTLNSEATVIKETDINGVKLKEIYFSGREVNGKRPRGYGILATNKPDAPLIVIIGDYNHEVCEEYVLSYASRGFSVFMFDYAGEYGSKTKYTFYPQEIDYANFSRAERHLNYADIDVRQTSYFEWVLQSYYAISACFSLLNGYTFKTGLIGIGCGADIVWMLSSFDKRISAYCTVFSAGWDAYKEIYKYSENNTLKDISDERERWLAGISSESYAKFVNAPMLYVSSSNSAKTDMDRAYDTVSRISKDIDTFMCISARLSDYINYYNKQNILLFFKKYLQDENIILPPKANTVIKNIDDTIAVTVEEAVVQDIKKVTVFCSEGELNPVCRNWFGYDAEEKDGIYTIYPKIYNSQNLIFAYANIQYKSGFTQSTNLCVKKASDLLVTPTQARRQNVIYNSEMGKDCFTVFNTEKPSIKDIFFDEYQIVLKKGAGDIMGVTALCGNLATYKTGDANFKGAEDESFKFDVFSPLEQELTIYFFENSKEGKEHYHSCNIKLMGGNIWHPVEIKKENLKTKDGFPLKSWDNVKMTGFSAKCEYLINNILWI